MLAKVMNKKIRFPASLKAASRRRTHSLALFGGVPHTLCSSVRTFSHVFFFFLTHQLPTHTFAMFLLTQSVNFSCCSSQHKRLNSQALVKVLLFSRQPLFMLCMCFCADLTGRLGEKNSFHTTVFWCIIRGSKFRSVCVFLTRVLSCSVL